MTTLTARDLTLGYGDAPIVRSASHEFAEGRVTVLIGPNGCGKSTLLKGLTRILRPAAGTVELGGRELRSQSTRAIARELGILPQSPIAPEGITVRDLVSRGRYPHRSLFGRWSDEDEHAVNEALELTSTLSLADRQVDELSGGQRQRVWIALALAQRTPVLLLDEPTTYLDLTHQIEVLDVVRRLNRERGTTIVMVLHDLNLAARYGDELVVMRAGELCHRGAPHEVLTAETLHDVFGLEAQVIADPITKTPLVVPIGRFDRATDDAPCPAASPTEADEAITHPEATAREVVGARPVPTHARSHP